MRVIAATNRDLQGAITASTFRSDLFYRLNVFPITLPPLRDRKEDIPALASYFVDRYAKRAGRKIRGIRKSAALDSLQSYSWPGNIRELQNVIERSLIVCETDEFTIDQSWLSAGPAPTDSTDQASTIKSAPGERDLIEVPWPKPRARCQDHQVPQRSSAFRPLPWNRDSSLGTNNNYQRSTFALDHLSVLLLRPANRCEFATNSRFSETF